MAAAPRSLTCCAIAPSATYSGLSGETLVRLMPDDRALARAVAHWLEQQGVAAALDRPRP